MLTLDPPPGFEGLSREKPVTMYFRHLPHWRQDGATYFVTFRLADSIPANKRRELRLIRAEWVTRHFAGLEPPTNFEAVGKHRAAWKELTRLTMKKVEFWLDQGMGECWLRRPDLAEKVAAALEFFDGERYELGAYVVMPNHVHLLVRPLAGQALEAILHSRKLKMTRDINEAVGRKGQLWQQESFDRIVRDTEHLYHCAQYIGGNARKAGLSVASCPRWIRPEWETLGWKFDLNRR